MVSDKPEEILRQYNEIAISSPAPAALQRSAIQSTYSSGAGTWAFVPQHSWLFIAGLAIVIIVLVAWFAVSFPPAQHSSKTPEIPFEKIVQENEAAAISQNPVPQPQTPVSLKSTV